MVTVSCLLSVGLAMAENFSPNSTNARESKLLYSFRSESSYISVKYSKKVVMLKQKLFDDFQRNRQVWKCRELLFIEW